LLLAACDPVHDDAVDALGGETRGVKKGPLHRPGQPCLVCHDGSPGSPEEFSVAGTVFLQPSGTEPVDHARVELVGADGAKFELESNAAGNFYVSPDRYRPEFPLEVQVHYQGQTATMHSTIGREGSCAGCHSDPPGPDSPGHVYIQLDDGGVPP
jgi:hypothetical protein